MPLIQLGGTHREGDYPLLQARVHYDLVDVYLSACLTQTYTSKARVPTEVKYVFPLPPNASVCAFEAVIDRKRVIKGVAKEKEQAKAEYREAKRRGRTAALLDQKTEEVFEMSLGNIPPRSVVDVRISFLSIIEQDGSMDTIRLTFPTTIAPHYGVAPTRLPTLKTSHVVELTLAITASAPIQSLSSVSHPIKTILGRTTEREIENFDPKLACVKFDSQRFLETDVVVVMRCRGLDRPRCTVESFLPEEGAEGCTDSYALTFVPRFESSLIPSQEYIFLVDQSGSMGYKMSAVRSALRIMLASLPASGTTFNIVSFGTSYHSIWSSSVNYDTDTVNEALRYVDRMEASYGGTEIASAIWGASRLRKVESGRPTAVFVLTDGEAWDLDGVTATVRRIADAGEEAESPIRFFCMGIGNTPSKALVDFIARAGNGVSLFVREDEGASTKLVTLLRAARSAPVENLVVDWGVPSNPSPTETSGDDDFEVIPPPNYRDIGLNAPSSQPISLYDEATTSNIPSLPEELSPRARKPVELPPPARIQQAPSLTTLPPLYPGFRYSVFAIVRRDIRSKETLDQRRSVRVTGTSQGKPVSLDVPLQLYTSALGPRTTAKFLHVIAARALIRSFEDRVPMSETDKAEVLRLVVRYGLSSSQTAFVAVEDEVDPTLQVSQVADDSNSTDNVERGRSRSRSGSISSISSPIIPEGSRSRSESPDFLRHRRRRRSSMRSRTPPPSSPMASRFSRSPSISPSRSRSHRVAHVSGPSPSRSRSPVRVVLDGRAYSRSRSPGRVVYTEKPRSRSRGSSSVVYSERSRSPSRSPARVVYTESSRSPSRSPARVIYIEGPRSRSLSRSPTPTRIIIVEDSFSRSLSRSSRSPRLVPASIPPPGAAQPVLSSGPPSPSIASEASIGSRLSPPPSRRTQFAIPARVVSGRSHHSRSPSPVATSEDPDRSVPGLARLQLPSGVFSPSDQLYELLGGPDTKDLLKSITARHLLAPSAREPSTASTESSVPESTNSAKQKGKKRVGGTIRRVMGNLRRSVDLSTIGRSSSSEGVTPLPPSAQSIAETLWTTFLVLAFMDGKLADSREEWILMSEKARAWIATALEQLRAECKASSEEVEAFSQALETEAWRVVEKL